MFDGKITTQSYADYTPTDHAVWARLHALQLERVKRHACREYLEGFERLDLPADRVVDIEGLNATIAEHCDWRFVGATGFLPTREFFNCLDRRLFPLTIGVRSMNELDFAALPDIFHDVFGHGPMVLHPEVAALYGEVGAIALRNLDDHVFLGRLAKLFWTVFEVGLLAQDGEVKAFGGALLSSSRELNHIFAGTVPRKRLDLANMVAWDYHVLDLQPEYTVLHSLAEIREALAMLEAGDVYGSRDAARA